MCKPVTVGVGHASSRWLEGRSRKELISAIIWASCLLSPYAMHPLNCAFHPLLSKSFTRFRPLRNNARYTLRIHGEPHLASEVGVP